MQDRGPGIPEAFRTRIVQKFAQADASDTRQKGERGLGLGISKAIVERFGGSMDFVSAPDQPGTTLPFAPWWGAKSRRTLLGQLRENPYL